MLRGNHHPIVFFPRLWLLHNHPSPNRPWTCRSHRLHQRCPCWKQNWALFGKQGVTQLLFLLLLVGCWLLVVVDVGCWLLLMLVVVCCLFGCWSLSLSLSPAPSIHVSVVGRRGTHSEAYSAGTRHQIQCQLQSCPPQGRNSGNFAN